MTATPQWLRTVQRQTADSSGTHSRGERESTYPFRYEHGRLRYATPVTLEIPMMSEVVTAAGKRKRRAKVVLGVAVAVLVAVLAYY